jgi:predicted  nucleic acid-binding Zn-ribbon protein
VRSTAEGDRWEVELRQLREEIRQLRQEQQEMAKAIEQLVTTFRTLAAHLGIAAEPYGGRAQSADRRDLPGFG